MSTLEIRDLHVSIDTEAGTKQILNGVSLTINSGETHAIMGPNGSGKSTLAYTIAGHPRYTVDSGEILLDGENVLEMSIDERARAGLFLAMQYPVEIPGVSVSNFLRTAKTAIDGQAPSLRTWIKDVKQAMGDLVTQCEAWGLVQRTPDPQDARARRIVFTETGLAWLRAFEQAVAQTEAEFKQEVGADVATVVSLGLEAYAGGYSSLESPP